MIERWLRGESHIDFRMQCVIKRLSGKGKRGALSLMTFRKLIEFWISGVVIYHCVKTARIRSYSGPHFPAFALNTERYFTSLRIQSECGEMWTRITPNTDTFYAVYFSFIYLIIDGQQSFHFYETGLKFKKSVKD